MSIVTLEEYKTYAGISSPNQDDQITPLLAPATEMVQNYLKIEFTSEDLTILVPKLVTETFLTAPLQQEYLLESWDIEVIDVQVAGVGAYTSEPKTLDPSLWFADVNIGKITLFAEFTNVFKCIVQYNTAKNPTELVKLATCMLIDYWKQKDFKNAMSNSGQSVSYTPVKVLPKHVENILNTYRAL